MKVIFVDGYNVINSWPNLKTIKKYSYESARKKLADIMENYAYYDNCEIHVVFDAHKVTGSLEKKDITGQIITVFTKDGETADAYIERMVNDIGKKIEVTVVTSDWLEQQTIFQRGAIRMSSLEFYHEVIKVEEKIRKKSEINKLSTNKNFLGDSLTGEVFKKLDEIRKSK
ncbi:NYN domain-containing protein [Clostridium tarantellae]|uniref:NYN domain-containing protein n=1 Tax=Clostridium tarantellae TaxID=39493 RepID=A0A6I1MIY7_9CLOT|nr:NYN domain-containing protein [Clostridium tarantellae]